MRKLRWVILFTLLLAGCVAPTGGDPTADGDLGDLGSADYGSDDGDDLDPWAEELALHVRQSARFHGYGEVMVAGPSSAPKAACVGAWTAAGAATGEILSKGCWTIGLVAAETGVGLLVAGACGVGDATQIDAILGSIIGAVAGLVACSAADSMPTDIGRDYTHFEAEEGTRESLSEVETRLRNESCPANDATEADADCWMYYHYTSAAGFSEIASTGTIVARNGQVFLTWLPYSPTEAQYSLFIGSTTHEGRGDFIVAFEKTDSTVRFRPGTSWNELIHDGSLRFGRQIRPIYAGPNPFR